MKHVTLASQTDFDGWRKAARAAAIGDIAPDQVAWSVEGEGTADLFGSGAVEEVAGVDRPQFNVPKAFVALAREVILHSDPERFALLYRLLWRLREHAKLLEDASDPDVDAAHRMEKSIHRDIHKMHAFVRFKEIVASDGEAAFISWFEPDHYIVEAAAPFFMRRFTGMRWSILTPHASAFWDRETLSFGPGADKSQVPNEDRLEEYWRTYYASIFNPARLKVDAMQKEMPRKYWKNLPEARLIDGLIRDAAPRMDAMIEAEPTAPSRLARTMAKPEIGQQHGGQSEMAEPPASGEVPKTLDEARTAAASCTRCDLHGPATQTVFGVGPETAQIIFVGEQPGDKEDLAGRPFVGPAGQVLDRALKDAGIDRDKAYVTNAVKHFKYEPRGKFRLHKTPETKEITACRYWLDLEKSFLEPKIIVALGASAGRALLGRTVRIGAERGRPIPQGNDAPIFVTVHPSYLLRLPDEVSKEKEYARFVQDLAAVRTAAGL